MADRTQDCEPIAVAAAIACRTVDRRGRNFVDRRYVAGTEIRPPDLDSVETSASNSRRRGNGDFDRLRGSVDRAMEVVRGRVRYDGTVANTYDCCSKIVILANGQLRDAIQTSAPPFELPSRQHDRQSCGVHSRSVGRFRRDEAMLTNCNFQQPCKRRTIGHVETISQRHDLGCPSAPPRWNTGRCIPMDRSAELRASNVDAADTGNGHRSPVP